MFPRYLASNKLYHWRCRCSQHWGGRALVFLKDSLYCPHPAFVPPEDVWHDKQHRLNCLQLPGDTISSVPPASGAASPPELPAWISRQPACLSWPTVSYLIPENLSINSRVTRPTDRGHPSGPLMNVTGAHTADMGFTPGIKEREVRQVCSVPSMRGEFRYHMEYIATRRAGRKADTPEQECGHCGLSQDTSRTCFTHTSQF